jgi:hypothetical protein
MTLEDPLVLTESERKLGRKLGWNPQKVNELALRQISRGDSEGLAITLKRKTEMTRSLMEFANQIEEEKNK